VSNIPYESIISRVKEKLDWWPGRIADTPNVLRWSWWPNEPDFQDEISSDYGLDTSFSTLEKEFEEEVVAIRETLDELGHEPKLAEWQTGYEGAIGEVFNSANLAGSALRVWDQIAIPIRRRDDILFRIWAPRDLFGSPIIKSLPLNVFIYSVADHTASDRIEIERLKKKIENWRAAAMIFVLFAVPIALGIAAWVL